MGIFEKGSAVYFRAVRIAKLTGMVMLLSMFGVLPTRAEPVRHRIVQEGYNINWSFLPTFTQKFLANAAAFHPDIIRYPGGTVSKTWQWRLGKTSKRDRDVPHPLNDLHTMATATGAKVVFVLNMVHASLADQLAMLKEAQKMGIPIRYVEMGNEYYLGKGPGVDGSGKHRDNVDHFPSGREYAQKVNRWAPAIRAQFPNIQIGISLLGRSVHRSVRQKNWNASVMGTIKAASYDAVVYHVYVHLNDPSAADSRIQKRVEDLKKNMVPLQKKAVWITEYGVHAHSAKQAAAATRILADRLEPLADLLLSHTLLTRSPTRYLSLLTPPDGEDFAPLGIMFLRRRQEARHAR